MGGYLGLLLGSSILSIFTTGNKLVGRLAGRSTNSRRRNKQPEGTAEEELTEVNRRRSEPEAAGWLGGDEVAAPSVLTSDAWLTRRSPQI